MRFSPYSNSTCAVFRHSGKECGPAFDKNTNGGTVHRVLSDVNKPAQIDALFAKFNASNRKRVCRVQACCALTTVLLSCVAVLVPMVAVGIIRIGGEPPCTFDRRTSSRPSRQTVEGVCHTMCEEALADKETYNSESQRCESVRTVAGGFAGYEDSIKACTYTPTTSEAPNTCTARTDLAARLDEQPSGDFRPYIGVFMMPPILAWMFVLPFSLCLLKKHRQEVSAIFDRAVQAGDIEGVKMAVVSESSRDYPPCGRKGLPILVFFSSSFPTWEAAQAAGGPSTQMRMMAQMMSGAAGIQMGSGMPSVASAPPVAVKMTSPSGAGTKGPSLVAELKELSELKASGALSEAEFEDAKASVLAAHSAGGAGLSRV